MYTTHAPVCSFERGKHFDHIQSFHASLGTFWESKFRNRHTKHVRPPIVSCIIASVLLGSWGGIGKLVMSSSGVHEKHEIFTSAFLRNAEMCSESKQIAPSPSNVSVRVAVCSGRSFCGNVSLPIPADGAGGLSCLKNDLLSLFLFFASRGTSRRVSSNIAMWSRTVS